MKKKGFTLVELLVVIAIIALLMGILMPALARVRQLAYRMVCGTNLSGLGKAMLVYSNDNEEDYPVAGGAKSTWKTTAYLTSPYERLQRDAFGVTSGGQATIGSCWYLLIKFADVTPKQFICKGDVGAIEFKLADAFGIPTDITDSTEIWDFGKGGAYHYSYAYHNPFRATTGSTSTYAVTNVSNPASPLASDKNPYMDTANTSLYLDGSDQDDEPQEWIDGVGYSDPDKVANAAAHQRDGQNVLFNDMHVNFEKYPNCGINNDNIFHAWADSTPPTSQEDREMGELPAIGGSISNQADSDMFPKSTEDSVLVNDDRGRT
jgi:prepilin-type N-terminal cleavage/methylation domain-containing protein